MAQTDSSIVATEFADAGSILKVNSHKLHEHESSLLIEEVRAYLDQSQRNLIILDVESVEFMSSAGLGAMVTLNTELAKRGGRLVIIGLSSDAMQVVKLTHLDKLIPIEKNIAKAQKRLLK